jgi:hypothetical protein
MILLMNSALLHTTPRPLALGLVPMVDSDYSAIGTRILAELRAEQCKALVRMTPQVAEQVINLAIAFPLAILPETLHFAKITLEGTL